MLSLGRILGKDVLSLIGLYVHRLLVQELNAEYHSNMTACGTYILFRHFAYNFRNLNGTWDCLLYDKEGHYVAELPKNY